MIAAIGRSAHRGDEVRARQSESRFVQMTLVMAMLFLAVPFRAAAGDWPQWRFDANRSGATEQAGPEKGDLLWQAALGRPDPAYDHQYRMCADVTYAPIAAEGLVFIPSNATDQVVACDLQTGALRWRFLAESPVRFAPVYHKGKVCFTCDDGYLYCVSAQQGKLLWQVRGAPDSLPDSRMLINGRLCSRWPARGAAAEQEGVIYFGAGIWPEEGVYLTAVDAETGRVLWRSDRMSYVQNGMSDHGKAYDLSLPPQGYLAVIDGRLAVPSGRSLAAWFDPATGTMEPYTCLYVKTSPPRGTWYLAGIRQFCVQGGNWFGTRADAAPPLPSELAEAKSAIFWSREMPENERYFIEHRPFLRADTYRLHNENLYTEPVLTETTIYASEFADEAKYLVPRGHTHVAFPQYDRIVARDLTRPRWTSVVHPHTAYGGRKEKMPRLEFPVLWEVPSSLGVLLKAGDRLYAGGQDTVAAIVTAEQGKTPGLVWETPVDGRPVHALVADGKLVVVTDNGNVYCFGDKDTARQTPEVGPACRAGPAGRGPARQAGPTGDPPTSYACIFGWDSGARATALARDGYRVIVFEPDAEKAAEARDTLTSARLHGKQVQVVHGSPTGMSLTPYWANLVVAESLDRFGSPEAALSVALDLLRPYTGKLLLPQGRGHADLLKRLLSERTGYTAEFKEDAVVVQRQAPPAGADDWTHEAGGPHNGFGNSEQRVKWPLAALWYSGDIDRYFTPASHFQHERNPYPLVAAGRMFLITGQYLHAVDIYTGDYLWKAEMPMTPWVQTRLFDSRVYGRPTERNCVAAADRVYAVTGEKIHAYDAATGRLAKVFDIPPQLGGQTDSEIHKPQQQRYMAYQGLVQAAPQWTEVRLWNDRLLAMLGQNLVALDRHTGQLGWTRPSTRETTTYALGSDMLFGLDCDVPHADGGGEAEASTALLFAMNPETGQVIWQKQPPRRPPIQSTCRTSRP